LHLLFAGPGGIVVTLNVYSGKAPPTLTVAPTHPDYDKIRVQAQGHQPQPLPPSALGYRGFTVALPETGG